jgi:two-component system, OmpR family, response regulator BaeR
MAERILLVEDEHKMAAVLVEYLQHAGYEVEHMHRGDAAEDWLMRHPVDVVLLDIMLPGKSGLDLCKALRAGTYLSRAAAVIMITAQIEEIDRLLGLELGADDYICKPFSPREVVARVKAVLRRGLHAVDPKAAEDVSTALQFDDRAWTARLLGQPLELTAVEYKLLRVLSARPGRIFSRDQLIQLMYEDDREVSDRTVDSHIKKLRRKLNELQPEQDLIQSVYGLGYKYLPPND